MKAEWARFFLATRDDGEFQQKVAVKVIRREVSSETILRRFLNERQILAGLEHPNIARLIDGGTTGENVPYLVMEYVEGLPISDYADINDLGLTERLGLFRRVCAAVAHAHKNLVIHRDLKPSNILVSADGEPKLLDFGIAKILKADNSNETQTRQFVFTPDYASPEQMRGEKLTTATDVYSLGVILYELLTGIKPHTTTSRNISEVIRFVCETEPERPSSVVSHQSFEDDGETNRHKEQTDERKRKTKTEDRRPKTKDRRALRGDLDNIILKALRKEPERRYSSVEQFAEDIRRHLAGLPVTARRDTWNYRAGKFISRNRLAVAFAALVVLALIGGIIGTTWQSARAERERAAAERERERAERRFENLRKISNSLVSEIERAIRDLPGSLPARQLLLTRAVEQLDALAAEADGNTALQLELVWAYQNLGSLPDKKLVENRAILEKAVALTEKIIAADPTNNDARERLAMLYLDLIFNSRLRGDVNFTLEYNRKAVAIIEDLRRQSADSPELKDSVWTVYYHYALTQQQLGKASETVETGRKILPVAEEAYRAITPEASGYDYMKPHLTHAAIGFGLNYAGEYRAAIIEFQTALAECQAEFAKRPEADILRRNEANIRLQFANALENSGDADAALKHAQIALALREKMAADNVRNIDFQIALADVELFLGQMLARQNQLPTVIPRFRRALASYEKILAVDAERVQVKILVARTKASLGSALVKNGDVPNGLRYLREAVEFYESANSANSIDAHLKRHFAEARALFATALVKNKLPGNYAEARESYRQSLELWRDLQRQGILRHSDASQPEEVSRQLAELENLQSRVAP